MTFVLRTYIINIATVALIGGILIDLLKNGFGKEFVRLIYGLLLTLAILLPVSNIELNHFEAYAEPIFADGECFSSAGEEMAQQALNDIIKQETETYIQNTAAGYGAVLTVDVILKEGIPYSVVLEGNISPYAKTQMAMTLQRDLNISKENQQWISLS